MVGILTVTLGASVDDVSQVLPAEQCRRSPAKHSMLIELGVRRCTVGQDEHQGEGTKEGEDKFP